MNFKGIFVPIITPFDEKGSIHHRGLQNVIEYLSENDIKGVWLLGSYGSFPLLSEKERIEVADVALPIIKKLGMEVIVNVGSLSTDMAVRLAQHAQGVGADAVASVVPFYYATSHYSEKNFLKYFESIIKAVNIPLFFYNNVTATGFNPQDSFFRQLIELGIKGFKDKGDYLSMANHVNLLKEKFQEYTYLSGSTSVQVLGNLLGASGVTSGVALAVPKLIVELQNALDVGDIGKAIKLQDVALRLRSILGRYVGRAVACYDILNEKGVDVGTCRSPWLRMEKKQTREIMSAIKQIEEIGISL